jgi:hypothetical protein
MRKGGQIILLAALLSGCAAYTPQPLEITDPTIYAADVSFCQAAATAYKPSMDLSSVAYGGLSGGAQNLTGAAISPLVPLIGLAGGATSALSTSIDIFGRAKENVLRHCLMDRTKKDGSALIADPSD